MSRNDSSVGPVSDENSGNIGNGPDIEISLSSSAVERLCFKDSAETQTTITGFIFLKFSKIKRN